MESLFLIGFFVLGTIFGSFFNVVGLRMPQGISFVHGPSSCPACTKPLQWYELIPILSYVLQRGKCTRCHHHLSLIYPFIECTTGCLFVISYIQLGLTSALLPTLLFISFLMIIVVTDLTYMVIPNKLLFLFLVCFIFIHMVHPLQPLYDAIIGTVVGFVLVALIIVISKGGMGAGDMKLLAVLGLVLGTKKVLLTFFIAVCVGAIVGLILMYWYKNDKTTKIAFAPFLALGAVISYFYGTDIIALYLTTLS